MQHCSRSKLGTREYGETHWSSAVTKGKTGERRCARVQIAVNHSTAAAHDAPKSYLMPDSTVLWFFSEGALLEMNGGMVSGRRENVVN